MLDEAEIQRHDMLELASEHDEEMMELYIHDEEISKEIWGSTYPELELALQKWDALHESPALLLVGPNDGDNRVNWRAWLAITRMTEDEFKAAFYYWEEEDWWICVDEGINNAVKEWLEELYGKGVGSVMADFEEMQVLAGCD